MTHIVPRTCTELEKREPRHSAAASQPLSAFRDYPAYVLLGEPGAGKTEAFKAEAALQSDALKVTARDFVTFDADNHQEWRGKTLFIDGLDEVRAGSEDKRPPLDQIRRNLDKLGTPPFRLSCRAADWLGNNDTENLAAVSPSGSVAVLRLDPLTELDMEEILHENNSIEDPRAFIANARSRGLEGFLANPLTLDLLAKTVDEGSSPNSRLDAFEKACRTMVTEHSNDHLSARLPADPEQVLDTTGRLYATLLIAGAAGCARIPNAANDDYPYMTACGRGDTECREAVATKLFSYPHEGRATPVHRHVAEFLGARHLASLIDNGLPGGRVLALITGPDGGIVTQLRGLSGWLAAHSPKVRLDLIERDPIGVGLYGDIKCFSLQEKHALLASLARNPRQVTSTFLLAHAFAALADPGMCEAIRKTLENETRDDDHQRIVTFVLHLLMEGPSMPSLCDLLLQLIRDPSWSPGIKQPALGAYLHCHDTDDDSLIANLIGLLNDLDSGVVDDPGDELLGTLLPTLYPAHLAPSDLWPYLTEGRKVIGDPYWAFWNEHLIDQSSDADVAILLDGATSRLPDLRRAIASRGLPDLLSWLLVRGLEAYGDDLPIQRLYDWLAMGIDDYKTGWYSRDSNARAQLETWLEARPKRLKAIVEEGVARCPEPDHIAYLVHELDTRLFGAGLPHDIDLWRLDSAITIADSKPKVAEHLLGRVVHSKRVDPEVIREKTQNNRALAAILDQNSTPPPPPSGLRHLQHRKSAAMEKQAAEQAQWLDYVRANTTALRGNTAPPLLLHQLSRTYLGDFLGVKTEGGTRAIEAHVEHDADLRDAILAGLRQAVFRDDIPNLDQVVELLADGRMHLLGWPFLAGLAEAERVAPLDVEEWTEDRMRKALAFYYAYPHGNYEPRWYSQLVQARPETVAEVQIRLATAAFRNRIKDSNTNLWHLAHDNAHREVARLSALPLLRTFPSRCRQERFAILDYLLWAAIQYADRDGFAELIARKLSLNSMMPTQRGHWLAAGCVIAPDEYAPSIRVFLQAGRREERIRHFAAFFFPSKVTFSLEQLGVSALALLARLTGRCFGPYGFTEGYVTPERKASDLVLHLIRCLEGDPTEAAGAQLASLAADPSLRCWHAELTRAVDRQQVIRRDHSYCHPSVEEVRFTLVDETPANAADLAALATDRIRQVGLRIKTGNANAWRPYWNEDDHGNRDKPKHEESCRDALLDALRPTLPRGVDAQPEGRYANSARADIRIAYGGLHLPVEIKKDQSPDLWSAPRAQLIDRYANDPATGGHGIYVVFWFGTDRTPPAPSGRRPRTAAELQTQLETGLSIDERKRISVCVINVTH